ncbi:aminoglycoside 6-adenylyltransferase [Chloroflexota bacterium]
MTKQSIASEPQTYDQLVDRFLTWARGQEDIVGAFIIGSRARTSVPADQWSDLDLVMVTTEPERYVTQTDWLTQIGPYWLTFLEKVAVGDGFERRVLFEGGLDVDFVPMPFDAYQQMSTEGWPAEILSVLQRGYRVILDRQGGELAKLLPPLDPTPSPPQPPTLDEFDNLCHDFLYHVVWMAKKLRRGELWMAKACVDDYMKWLLLRMVEWHAQARNGGMLDTWHGGRFLEKWADPRVIDDLGQAFAHYDKADLKRALLATVDLFGWVAQETAQELAYQYPTEADQQVTDWVIDCLEEIETRGPQE